jgi:hypothetical protein
MTVYRKCQPCKHRDGCEIKANLAAAIKGFGVGTISHRCKKYAPEFVPGDNLWVRVQSGPYGNDYDGNPHPSNAEFPAYFVGFSKSFGRAIVHIAEGAESKCGQYSFEAANNKDGFCKVSYAPIRTDYTYTGAKGITARREGHTAINTCCGRPRGSECSDCQGATV